MLCIIRARLPLKTTKYRSKSIKRQRHNSSLSHGWAQSGWTKNGWTSPSCSPGTTKCFSFDVPANTRPTAHLAETGFSGRPAGIGSLLLSLNHQLPAKVPGHLIPTVPSRARPRARHKMGVPVSAARSGGKRGDPHQQSGCLPQQRAETFLMAVGGWQCPPQKPLLGLFSFCLCFPIQEKASVTTAADSFSDLVPSVPDITFVGCQSGKNNDLPAHFSSVDYVGGGEGRGERSFN